ncbi:MAG: hypothetical protein JWN30_303 [Bacilli bacterium]|nr:hypothetical protein [Bacilli bacterium]
MEDTPAVQSLTDLLGVFEDWLSDRQVNATLEWGEEEPVRLCSFEGPFDYCDLGDHGPDNPKTFDFFFITTHDEPYQMSILLEEEEDVEVNLEDEAIEIGSGPFLLRLTTVSVK